MTQAGKVITANIDIVDADAESYYFNLTSHNHMPIAKLPVER